MSNGSPYISSSLDDERLAEALGDRVGAVDDPDPLALAGLAPLQVAGRAHQPLEDLRVVARVEDDQAHPVEHAPLDALDDRVGDLVVRDVAPPGQDVGRREDRVGQAVLGLVERGRPDVEPGLAQAVGDRAVDAVRVDRARRRVGALLAVLVPDRDPGHRRDGLGHAGDVGARRHGSRQRDDGATALGRFADRVPQARHPQADLGRARVRGQPGANVQELIPDRASARPTGPSAGVPRRPAATRASRPRSRSAGSPCS